MENTGIKSWAEEDRPREKLVTKGCRALSDTELLAIFIRTGTPKKSAIDVSRELLLAAQNSLDNLGKMSVAQMVKLKISGLGKVKATTIVAALELGRRRRETSAQAPIKKITSSKDAYHALVADLEFLLVEEFWILLLDRSNQIIKKINISKGGISGTVADAKVIFKYAIEHSASGIVLCHNHPSGNLQPSQADRDITKSMKAGGLNLDITVHDHIIIAGNAYLSFADEGYM
jgi:DNA repair protein RadC